MGSAHSMASNPWEQECGNGLGTAVGYNSADHLLLHCAFPNVVVLVGVFSVQTARMVKCMLNQADSFLMTKMWTQTYEVQGSSNLQTHVVCCNIQPRARGKRKHLHVENAVKSRYLLIHFPDLS